MHFVGLGEDLGTAGNSITVTSGANPFVGGVLPWATIEGPSGFDLVRDADGTPGGVYSIGRVLDYENNIDSASGGIVKLNGGTHTITANRAVQAILLLNGATINGAHTLEVGSSTGTGLIVARGGTSAINSNLSMLGSEALVLAESATNLVLNGSVSATNFRKERNGQVTFSGNNAGMGSITIADGLLTATHAGALGLSGGITTVNAMAALHLDAASGPFNFGAESLILNGTGLDNDQLGALRLVNGDAIFEQVVTSIGQA
jgi:hypothetical protein